jgi:hypothetical protein
VKSDPAREIAFFKKLERTVPLQIYISSVQAHVGGITLSKPWNFLMEQLKSARFFIESVPGHSVIAVHQNALRTQALGNEGGGGLEAGQEVGVGHVRNGDLENRLQPLKKSFFNIFEKNRFITFLEKTFL